MSHPLPFIAFDIDILGESAIYVLVNNSRTAYIESVQFLGPDHREAAQNYLAIKLRKHAERVERDRKLKDSQCPNK